MGIEQQPMCVGAACHCCQGAACCAHLQLTGFASVQCSGAKHFVRLVPSPPKWPSAGHSDLLLPSQSNVQVKCTATTYTQVLAHPGHASPGLVVQRPHQRAGHPICVTQSLEASSAGHPVLQLPLPAMSR